MAKFIEFSSADGHPVLVNVDLVRRVSRWDDSHTHIFFDKEDQIVVKLPTSQVMIRLKS